MKLKRLDFDHCNKKIVSMSLSDSIIKAVKNKHYETDAHNVINVEKKTLQIGIHIHIQT